MKQAVGLAGAVLLAGILTIGLWNASNPRPAPTLRAPVRAPTPRATIAPPPALAPPRAGPPPFAFRAQELPFRYERGESGAYWPAEPIGGGVGLLDYDGDGDLDLFFAQGVPLPVGKSPDPPADCLLRNDGAGRFADVSAEAGLTSRGYGQGVTVADYDGDGDVDVYVTRLGANTLWRNDGGRFVDVTARAGVGCGLWSLGAAFADYDGDGDLDLFVATYFTFDPALAPFERDPETGRGRYGVSPAGFVHQPDSLFRNEGGGRFVDVSKQAGIAGDGPGMGVLAADFDGDGRVDFLVANDLEPNALWHNRGDGTFEDVALSCGIAFNARGEAEANMGIAHGDVDGNGLPDVLISHYFNQHHTLWCASGIPGKDVFFLDTTSAARLAFDSRPTTGWGAAFADFDQDGRLDFVVTNGHIRPEPGQRHLYENPPLLWRNVGGGRFSNESNDAGPYFRSSHQGRGLASGDLDGDGDLDLVIVQHHAPSVVLWNESPAPGHYLIVDPVGLGANRDAIGARLVARVGDRSMVRTIDGGGSYLSSNDRRPHFGLGRADRVDSLEIRWPSGKVETRANVPADQVLRWSEGESSSPKP